MESQGFDHAGFKGFTANRFGRIAEMAKEFLSRQQSVMEFLVPQWIQMQINWFLLFPRTYRMIGFCVVLGFILS